MPHKMNINISNVLSVNTNVAPYNFTSYMVGSCKSGEIYNEATIVVRPPGLRSTPLPAGSTNSQGQFTPAPYSQYSSQSVNIENSSNWITLGMRDNRTEVNLPTDPTGSTRLFAEANPGSSVYLDIEGNIWLQAANNIVLQPTQGTANVLVKTDGSINLMTTANNTSGGTTVGMTISPINGINLGNQYGSLAINSGGVTLTAGQASLQLTPAGEVIINGQIVNIQGPLCAIQGTVCMIAGTGGTFIGSGASPATPALAGLAVGTPGNPVIGLCKPSTLTYIGT